MLENHNSPKNSNIEKAIRQRDHNQCQLCHRHESEGIELRVHQIVPTDGADTTLTNYVLLCSDHYEKAVNRQEAN